MKHATIGTLLLIVLVAILVVSFVQGAVGQLQAGCQVGEVDAGLCRVAETAGLLTEPTPAQLASEEQP